MTYFKLLKNWLFEGKFLFLAIILILLTTYLDNFNFKIELVNFIRIYGLLLQLFGTIVILISLKQKLLLFKGHGLTKLFLNYFKRFPLSSKTQYVDISANLSGTSSMSADLRAVKRPTEDLKDVIRYFDEEIQYLHQRIANNKNDNTKEFQDVKDNIENLKNSLNDKINDTKKLIVETSISNPWLELLGIVCIFWGLILGTIPDYVENLLF